ncbi:unnamed protein product [Rotaria sp. Silwood1]|nr:unnamed protein product [Rotaria sp. Silwood1]CAF1643944.1 unnamed protein product [Rotaria sp. Silwood1]CAF3820079.1 unnamed protein product [Rotaria sp. Silwood1]CAF3824541.1 unnamed protein product [Rotaria sp. Silwood1]CAF4756784.1 unnamed protein product [Rotaria sp. Silwood1]
MNILWLHDNINDHKELDKQLKNFEKPIINFTDDRSCIAFLKTSEQENNDRPSVLIVLNRIGRQIVPEIHSYTTLLSIVIFCTKNDNKIKWANKYNKIRGIFIDPKELKTYVRQVIQISGLLVLLDEHPNEIIQQQLYRLDSSLIIIKRIHSCLSHFRSVTYKRPLMLISTNALGRQIVPEIHSDNQLKAIFIYYVKNDTKIRWTTKYNKIKLVTTNIIDLINGIRNEGLYYSALLWHLVCLDDHSDEVLRHHLYELDPCIRTFDRFDICQTYLDSINQRTIATKPVLFVAINRMGRQFIPEIHSNDRLKAFYIFISSDSTNDRKTKWTTKYNKIKRVCADINQLIAYIKQDAAVLTHSIIRIPIIAPVYRLDYQDIHNVSPSSTKPDYLTDLTDEKISFIVSDAFGQHIVPLIHEIPQIKSIYVFCGVNKSNYEAWAKDNIGSVLRNQNQLNEALEYMERALHIELLAPQPNSLKIASYHNNIGLVLTDLNNFNSALIYYEQAFKIQQKYLPPNHPDLATSYNNIGAIYNELQDYSKALSFYEKSLDIMQRSLPLNHPDLAVPYNNLASIYNELQEYSKALLYYEKSIQIMQKSLPPNHPFLALAYHNLALTFYRLRSYKTALEYGERAIEIYYRALEPNDPQVITCQETLNAIREKL